MARREPAQVTRYLYVAKRFPPMVIDPGHADALAWTEAPEEVGAAAVAVRAGMASAAQISDVRSARRTSVIGIQSWWRRESFPGGYQPTPGSGLPAFQVKQFQHAKSPNGSVLTRPS